MSVFLSAQNTLRTGDIILPLSCLLLKILLFLALGKLKVLSLCLSTSSLWVFSLLPFYALLWKKKVRGIGWSDLPFRWKKEAFSLTLTLYLLWYFLNCNIKQHLHSQILLKWHRISQVNPFQSSPLWATLTESRMFSYLASSSKYFNLKQMSLYFISWVHYIFKNK